MKQVCREAFQALGFLEGGCGGGLLSFVPDTLLACVIIMWSNNQLLLNIVILLFCPGF